MSPFNFLHGKIVGDHNAVKAPLVPQNVGEQLFGSSAGHAIQLVVGVHHRLQVGFFNGRFKRQQKYLTQFTRRNMRRSPVHTALGQAVAHKMLGSRHNPFLPIFPLQATHKMHAHLRHQVRVLAKRFFHPPPARIARHVQHRRKPLMRSHRAHLCAHHVGHRLYQFWLPGAGDANNLRETSGIAGHKPAATLFMHHCRNAQPRFFDQVPLNAVGHTRCFSRCQTAGPAHARNLPQPQL